MDNTNSQASTASADISSMPTFTVIVPLYNCERYIAECLTSLKSQTYGDFEALVVDDGSADNGLKVAKGIAGDDSRFKFFQLPENRGQSAARNCALDHALGKIVILLDADDLLAQNALELIAAAFEEHQLDDLYFGAESFYEDAAAYRCVVEEFANRDSFSGVVTGQELFTFFENRNQFYPHGALRAVRRELLEDNGVRFKEGIIHEDLLFTLQTLLLSKRTTFLNEPLYRRRIRTGSTMATPHRTMRNIEGHLVSIRFMRSWLIEHASELEPTFIAAMSHRLNAYLNVCAEDYLRDIAEEEKASYLESLSPEKRVEFEIDVAQRAEMLRFFYDSTTWRIGYAICAGPQKLRDKIVAARRMRG